MRLATKHKKTEGVWDFGLGVNNLLLNGGGLGESSFDNPTNGMAESWTNYYDGNGTPTYSVVTGNGFRNKAQRIEETTYAWMFPGQTITLKKGRTYRLRCKIRSTDSTIGVYFSSAFVFTSLTGVSAVTATSFDVLLTLPETFDKLETNSFSFLASSGGGTGWIEVGDIDLLDMSTLGDVKQEATLYDKLGNGNHLTNIGGCKIVPGPKEGLYGFDVLGDDEYMTLNTPAVIPCSKGEGTIAFWVKYHETFTTPQINIMGTSDGTGDRIYHNGLPPGGIRISLIGKLYAFGHVDPDDNKEWQHVAFVFSSAGCSLYVGGEFKQIITGLPTGDFHIDRLGRSHLARPADAALSDVRLFSESLSESDILRIADTDNSVNVGQKKLVTVPVIETDNRSFVTNTGGLGQTEMIDSNSDGIADGFIITDTASIITAGTDGWTMKAQRSYRAAGSACIVGLPFTNSPGLTDADIGKQYRFRFKYRSSHSVLNPKIANQGVFSGWSNRAANSGDPIQVDLTLTYNGHIGTGQSWTISTWHASEPTWLELSEIDFWELPEQKYGFDKLLDKAGGEVTLENVLFTEGPRGEENKALRFIDRDSGIAIAKFTEKTLNVVDGDCAIVFWAKLDDLNVRIRYLFGHDVHWGSGIYTSHTSLALIMETNRNGDYAGLNYVFTDTNWHHFVMSWDKGVYTLYVDGEYVGSWSTNFDTPLTLSSFGDHYQYGYSHYPLGGDMAEVMILERPVPAAEAKYLYTRRNSKVNISGLNKNLVAAWDFNLGLKTKVANSGGLGETDFVDTNADGLADGYTTIYPATTTIVTGNGFPGNAQRLERISNLLYLNQVLDDLPSGTYKISFNFRTNYRILYYIGSGGYKAIVNATADVLTYHEKIIEVDGSEKRALFTCDTSAAGGYFEIGNIELLMVDSLTDDYAQRDYFLDKSGKGEKLTVSGDVNFVDSPRNDEAKAIRLLSGANLTHDNEIVLTDNYTIVFWVKILDNDNTRNFFVGSDGSKMWFVRQSSGAGKQWIYMHFSDGTQYNGQRIDTFETHPESLPYVSEWIHVALTMEGGTAKAYLNGDLQVTKTVTDTVMSVGTFGSTNVNADLRNFYVWNEVKSENDIKNLLTSKI
jgi:hypothetical protein